MKADAGKIIDCSIQEVLPDAAVKKALSDLIIQGDIYGISFGKAAWQMAYAAGRILADKVKKGIVVTK